MKKIRSHIIKLEEDNMEEMALRNEEFKGNIMTDIVLMVAMFAISIFFILIGVCQFMDGHIGSGIAYSLISACSVGFVVAYKNGNLL